MKDNNYISIAERASIFNEMGRLELEEQGIGDVSNYMDNLNNAFGKFSICRDFLDYIKNGPKMDFNKTIDYIGDLNIEPICTLNYAPMFEIDAGPNIKDVIFNPPATIIIWDDGTKTVVKAGSNDTYDPEKGMALCISKKFLGNKGHYYTYFSKYLDKYLVEEMGKNMELSSEALKEMAKSAEIAANTIRGIVDGIADGMIEKSEVSSDTPTKTDDVGEMTEEPEILDDAPTKTDDAEEMAEYEKDAEEVAKSLIKKYLCRR